MQVTYTELTFIVLARTTPALSSDHTCIASTARQASSHSNTHSAPAIAGTFLDTQSFEDLDIQVSTLIAQCVMAGDVNVFLSQRYDDDDGPPTTWAELEVMIAEPHFRRCGLAREALSILLYYITSASSPGAQPSSPFPIPASYLFVRISSDNRPSISLFESLGFVCVKENAVFKEVEMHVRRLTARAPKAVLLWPES